MDNSPMSSPPETSFSHHVTIHSAGPVSDSRISTTNEAQWDGEDIDVSNAELDVHFIALSELSVKIAVVFSNSILLSL